MHALAAFALLLAQANAGAAAPAAPPPGATGSGAGRVSGKVTLTGLPPKLAPLPVTRDIKTCGTSKPDEALEVGQGGGVKNAVLWIADGPKPSRADKIKVTLDQKQCEFTPHVVAMPAGATLDIVNGDKLFHNVHARDADKTVFNYAMPVPNHVIPKPLKQPGLLRITCDVHPWMRAWVDVLPTSAFAVTDEAGSYTISGVPPGKHTLRLWHERLGDKEQQVGVTAGGTATVDVQLTPR
ncbi:MAG TPA: carboxypeptidase regulatory-like domain-containing protein [Myxococcales bacterium]|nr:carboxypeptidase regulatory-like domain-containing protein [Myxococcales bacterium]